MCVCVCVCVWVWVCGCVCACVCVGVCVGVSGWLCAFMFMCDSSLNSWLDPLHLSCYTFQSPVKGPVQQYLPTPANQISRNSQLSGINPSLISNGTQGSNYTNGSTYTNGGSTNLTMSQQMRIPNDVSFITMYVHFGTHAHRWKYKHTHGQGHTSVNQLVSNSIVSSIAHWVCYRKKRSQNQ